MTGKRKRTRFVPRSIFKTAAAGLAPALMVACGGEFETGNGSNGGGRTGTGGQTIIVLAIGGFGNGGSGGSTVIILAIGGFGNGGVMGVGGAFATGGTTGDASVPDGSTGGVAGTGGTASGGATGTGGVVGVGGIIVLAIGGFGTGLVTTM